jgi:hypothetical protein
MNTDNIPIIVLLYLEQSTEIENKEKKLKVQFQVNREKYFPDCIQGHSEMQVIAASWV